MSTIGLLRLRIIAAAVWIFLAFAASISAMPLHLKVRAQLGIPPNLEVPLARDEERIKVLERQVATLEAATDALNHDVWKWQGVVIGFGSIVSLIELFQGLGMIRSSLKRGS